MCTIIVGLTWEQHFLGGQCTAFVELGKCSVNYVQDLVHHSTANCKHHCRICKWTINDVCLSRMWAIAVWYTDLLRFLLWDYQSPSGCTLPNPAGCIMLAACCKELVLWHLWQAFFLYDLLPRVGKFCVSSYNWYIHSSRSNPAEEIGFVEVLWI